MSNTQYELLKDVHLTLKLPDDEGDTYLTKESYLYYHYCCDKVNDVGYGCAYRSIQSICSMLQIKLKSDVKVPSIRAIQEILVKIGDKEENFIGSKDWIGALEASFIFDELFNTPSFIHHKSPEDTISSKKDVIVDYFKTQGGTIFLGGSSDTGAKIIAGIHVSRTSNKIYLLVVDPHCSKIPNSVNELINSYVKWYSEDDFVDGSFYNFCMPQVIR